MFRPGQKIKVCYPKPSKISRILVSLVGLHRAPSDEEGKGHMTYFKWIKAQGSVQYNHPAPS